MPHLPRQMTTPDSWWTIIGSLATAAAAVFAGAQIWYSRRDANNRAAFEHLRQIDERVQATWHSDADSTQAAILAYYRGKSTSLSPAATAYLGLLNSLDLLALAVKHKVVAKDIVDEHVATLVAPELVPLSFLKEMQDSCANSRVYEHLYDYVCNLLKARGSAGGSNPHRKP